MKRYLIINPFGIGDVLFTTPVIRAIKEADRQSFIGYWCNQRVAPVLEGNPGINKIYALSRGDLKKIWQKSKIEGIKRLLILLSGIKKGNFDICLDFSLDHRYGLISKVLGIKRRIGFNYKGRGRFLTEKINISGYTCRHMVRYYLDLLQPLGIKAGDYNLELNIPEPDRIRARELLSSCGVEKGDLLIGIAPGGGESWGKDASLKHWPAKKFAQLADSLIAKFDAKVIILAGKEEKAIAGSIILEMRNKPIDLSGRTTLAQLAGVIDSLRILVANDAGPLHMAAALGKKTVAFFGPVDPNVYGPYPAGAGRHIILQKNLECIPCYAEFRLSACRKNKQCLEAISVDEALSAVAGLLRE